MLEILSHSSHFFPLYFMKFGRKYKRNRVQRVKRGGNPENITIFSELPTTFYLVRTVR